MSFTKYSGSFSVGDKILTLSIEEKFYPKKWIIDTCNKESPLVYQVQSSRDGNNGHCYSTRYYTCSMYQDGSHVYIRNESILDEE